MVFFYQAAQTGHPEAEWLVYCCIREGDGVQFDYPTSIEWLKKAAVSGNANAQYLLSVKLLLGEFQRPDFEGSYKYLCMAATQSHVEAINLLGNWMIEMSYDQDCIRWLFYYGGIAAQVNKHELDYFTQESQEGNGQAQFTLGHIYRLGRFNLEFEKANADEMMKKSAAAGYEHALYNVFGDKGGRIISYITKAAELEYPEGMTIYGGMLEDGEFGADKKKDSISWYKKASDLKYINGEYQYARCMYVGNYIQQDKDKALEILYSLAQRGHGIASQTFGHRTKTFHDPSHNHQKGFVLIEKSANLDSLYAINQLVYHYFLGGVIPRDEEKGAYWLKKAQQKSHILGLLHAANEIYIKYKEYETSYKYLLIYEKLSQKLARGRLKQNLEDKLLRDSRIKIENAANAFISSHEQF